MVAKDLCLVRECREESDKYETNVTRKYIERIYAM